MKEKIELPILTQNAMERFLCILENKSNKYILFYTSNLILLASRIIFYD